jgi:ATP synthase protein I
MQANDVRVLKGAAVPTLAVGLVAVVLAAVVTGVKGALGAGIGLVLVAVFFTLGLVVVSWAGRVSPMAMMAAAVVGYVVKVLAIMAMLTAFEGTTAFNSRAFALSVIACTLAWTVGEMRGFLKLKMLYVEPDVEVPGRGPR